MADLRLWHSLEVTHLLSESLLARDLLSSFSALTRGRGARDFRPNAWNMVGTFQTQQTYRACFYRDTLSMHHMFKDSVVYSPTD